MLVLDKTACVSTVSVVVVSASFIAVVFSVTVYNWMGKVSGIKGRSKDTSGNIRFKFCVNKYIFLY